MSALKSDLTAPPRTARDYANELKSVESIDPGIGAYRFNDLGQVMQFAEVMSKAGAMVPEHCRGSAGIPVCTAITLRALQWGFDPFGLALESYQAQQGGPVSYQAKVFSAALQQCAGIHLKYRFTGSVTMLDKPVTSHKGREIAKRTATGDRVCIAYWVDEDGETLEYETMPLDSITIKNSPLWHNDPDQQLSYYAARGWARRYRPAVIMGAFSTDEAKAMAREKRLRDVTPAATGFAQLAQEARQKTQAADTEAENEGMIDDSEPKDGTILDILNDAYIGGTDAYAAGLARSECPHTDDPDAAMRWLAGWDAASDADVEAEG